MKKILLGFSIFYFHFVHASIPPEEEESVLVVITPLKNMIVTDFLSGKFKDHRVIEENFDHSMKTSKDALRITKTIIVDKEKKIYHNEKVSIPAGLFFKYTQYMRLAAQALEPEDQTEKELVIEITHDKTVEIEILDTKENK